MFGREFQVLRAVQRIEARRDKVVLWGRDGVDSGTVEERKLEPETIAVMRQLR